MRRRRKILRIVEACTRHCEAHDESSIEEKCLLRRGNLLNRRMGLNRMRLPRRRRKSSKRLTFFPAPRNDVLDGVGLELSSLRGAL